mgnify:CR=1 FL=1
MTHVYVKTQTATAQDLPRGAARPTAHAGRGTALESTERGRQKVLSRVRCMYCGGPAAQPCFGPWTGMAPWPHGKDGCTRYRHGPVDAPPSAHDMTRKTTCTHRNAVTRRLYTSSSTQPLAPCLAALSSYILSSYILSSYIHAYIQKSSRRGSST